MKKVVTSVGQFKNYYAEIQQSYVLGFTPYCGAAGPGGPPGKIGKIGAFGARGEQGDKGDTGGVGQQGTIGPQGGTGPQGSQGATGAAGPKGGKGDPTVDIDIVAELCKHLPMEMVEQYRRGSYVRYAINSMKDIELHVASHVKDIIDKGGSCNTTQSNVTRMASLSQSQVNSNYVLNFHSDAYNMDADMADFHYFCVFLVYKIKAYARIKHWERNYLISNWNCEKETKYRGIYFLPDQKTLCIHGGGSVFPMFGLILEHGGKRIHEKRINSMLYVWSGLGSHRVPTQHYGLMELMYLTLIQLLCSDQIRS